MLFLRNARELTYRHRTCWFQYFSPMEC